MYSKWEVKLLTQASIEMAQSKSIEVPPQSYPLLDYDHEYGRDYNYISYILIPRSRILSEV